MKKFFEYIGLLGLVCFSFFITEKTVSVVEEVDEIMVQIKEHQDEYYEAGENAIIFEQYIIPGLASKVVNVDKSYQEMKKIGVYDPTYYQYDTEAPLESIDNHLDKYISQGNSSKRMVSLIFLMDDYNVGEILEVIGDVPVTFGISSYSFQKQVENVELALEKGDDFIIMEETEKNFLATKQKLESLNVDIEMCYNPDQNEDFLALCQKHGFHSISSDRVISKSPLKNTKELLHSGALLVFEVNKQLLEELPNIISYIQSRGYQIQPLSIHLKED